MVVNYISNLDQEKIDIKENFLFELESSILILLLKDQTTKKNLIWATNDYEKYGIFANIMSRKIVESKNVILQSILNFCEKSLLYLIKYTDELKHFKDVHWKNR